MTSLAAQRREVTAKQGVREEGADEESEECLSLPFPPSTSEPLAPTNTAAFLLIGFTGSFYINKQTALVGTSSGLAPSSGSHSRARRCRGVPPSQGKR